MPSDSSSYSTIAELPSLPSERGAWVLACSLFAVGATVLVAVLIGALGRTHALHPPAVLLAAPTPIADASSAASALAAVQGHGNVASSRSASAQRSVVASSTGGGLPLAGGRVLDTPQARIATRWMEGFYPIYETAQATFGVNWLLLASIHMQESAFSTAPSTYHGLNFAHCCGGPMQFNVTNGPVTTWDLVANSYTYGRRPANYDHRTASHPSIYDDFDSIMAAAHLLSANGAGNTLDSSAWVAAFDYYGHDEEGVYYADEVLARAIGWSQHGFCINCGVQSSLVDAVHAAYGAPVLEALQREQAAAEATAARRARLRRRH